MCKDKTEVAMNWVYCNNVSRQLYESIRDRLQVSPCL